MRYLASRLKSARLMNGLSLQGLSDRIENRITKQALSKYEQGQVIPDSEMIGILAEALKVRTVYFHTDTVIDFGEIDSEESFDGFATWVNGKDIPLIVLNKAKFKNKLVRKRFTALYELGHLLLDVNGYEDKQKEKFCHAFASAMLIHKEILRQELGGKRSKLSMNELGAINQQYGISMQAWVCRAKNLGLISGNYLKQFYMVFNQLGFRVTEPVDYEGVEHSNRLSQLLFRGSAEEYISVSKAAALKNHKLAEFRKENRII